MFSIGPSFECRREPIPSPKLAITIDPEIHKKILAAADRKDRRTWAEHKARLELEITPLIPAPVVAQASWSPQQAQLRRFLTGCTIIPLGGNDAHEARRLLGRARTANAIDAVVVTIALRQKALILTGDVDHIKRLVAVSGRNLVVLSV